MRYCINCGNELGDTKFCVKCGTKAADELPLPNSGIAQKKTPAAVIAIILICAIGFGGFWIFGGRSYKSVVKKFMKAVIDGDAEKIVSLMPSSLIDYVAEEEYDGDKEDMISDLADQLEASLDELDENDIKASDISYKIIDEEDMDKDDIKEYKREFRKADLKIKEGKKIEIEVTLPADDDEETYTRDLEVAKIGRSWYLVGGF